MTIEESISKVWDFWCYFERSKRNKSTGSETFLESGKYNPNIEGLLRIGTKINNINSTEEIVERYLVALKPNIYRMNTDSFPANASLNLNFYSYELNSENSQLPMKIVPFANISGADWDSDSVITYYDIKDHLKPFDMTQSIYDIKKNLFEKTVYMNLEDKKITFESIENIVWKLLRSNSIGFTLSASGGYCTLYGPTYSMYFLRPFLEIMQSVPARVHNNSFLDTEIVAEGRVKGKCVDKDGILITGKQCRIIVFDMDKYTILGTGLSNSSNGEYLITTTSKIGDPVIVSFLNETDEICGSEIMTTLSKDTT